MVSFILDPGGFKKTESDVSNASKLHYYINYIIIIIYPRFDWSVQKLGGFPVSYLSVLPNILVTAHAIKLCWPCILYYVIV